MWEPILSQNSIRPGGYISETNAPLSDFSYIHIDGSLAWILYSGGGVGTEIPIGPFSDTTIFIEMKGVKFPTKLRSVDTNTITHVSTTTDQDMGPSTPSISITYAANHEGYLTFKLRF